MRTPIGILAIASFVWLVVFIGIAAGINKFRKKLSVNGALIYCWNLGIIGIGVLAEALFFSGSGLEATLWFISQLLPFLVGFYYARRFSRQKRASNVNDAYQTSR